MDKAVLIGVDWGSSNFRAYLFAHGGAVIAKIFSPHGIFKLERTGLVSFLQSQLKQWLIHYPEVPIILCGMIGSAKGWVEAPYLSCPAGLAELAQSLVEPPSAMQRCVRLIPGVSQEPPLAYLTDVMRGEETQLMGVEVVMAKEAAISQASSTTESIASKGVVSGGQQCTDVKRVVCLPGTHAKWVLMNGAVVEHFRTFMTGELFALLLQTKSIVNAIRGVGYQEKTNWDVFKKGVVTAQESQALLADAFNIRSQLLKLRMQPEQVRDYLSGLLMAYEVIQAKSYTDLNKPIILVASGKLAERYLTTFSMFDLSAQCLESELVSQRGLYHVAEKAGLC